MVEALALPMGIAHPSTRNAMNPSDTTDALANGVASTLTASDSSVNEQPEAQELPVTAAQASAVTVTDAIAAKQGRAAAKAAAKPAATEVTLSGAKVDATYPDCYLMERDGNTDASVNVNSVDAMKKLGWLLKAKTK